MVWSIKALEAMWTGQEYIVFLSVRAAERKRDSMCIVLPSCSLTDYFVTFPLVEEES